MASCRSQSACKRIQNCGEVLNSRARRNAVSAVMPRLPSTISFRRLSEMPSRRAASTWPILWLANIASGQRSLTVASPLGTLRAMRDVFGTGAAVRSAWSTRRDLLLENFALRHQLSVLARSNRLFRPSDRVLWLFCDGCGPSGGKCWCWSSQPPSIVGIARDSVHAGAVARGVLEDHVSIRHLEI